MAKIKIVTSKYESKMEELINALLSEGYEMHGELSTYDRWENEAESLSDRKAGRRIQVTYFKQVMIKMERKTTLPPYTPAGNTLPSGLSR